MKIFRLPLIAFILLGFTAQVFAVVNASERGLIAVVNLYSTAPTKLKRYIYQRESDRAVKFLRKTAPKGYDQVVVLENDEATLENFLVEVEKMSAREEIKVIDVIFDLHGFSASADKGTAIRFVNDSQETSATAEVAEQLRQVGNSKLRMLYSDACHGVEHNQDWLNAGFKVVAGSKDVDGNRSIDIKRFVRNWIKGKSFKHSIKAANSSALTPVLDLVVGGNSIKVVSGNEGLTISDEE